MNKTANMALVVDDDPFFRMALCAILEDRLGFSRVIEAASLDEAWEHLGEQPDITLGLFDLNMPGMNSPANLTTVCERFSELRVVVVSASRRREDVLSALQAGVHGYAPKGLGIDQLTDAIRLVIEGNIYLPSSLAEVLTQVQREALAQELEKPASIAPGCWKGSRSANGTS